MPLKDVLLNLPYNTFEVKRIDIIPGKKNNDKLPKAMELTASVSAINDREMLKRLSRLYGDMRYRSKIG